VKKNTLLGLTLISCIGVVFAVIFDDKIEETENPTDAEEEILENKEITTENEVVKFDVKQRMDELQLQYDEIIEYTCMESRPQSYFKIVLEERVLEAEHRLRYLSDQQSEIQNIKNEIQILNENNLELDNELFVLYEWECVNQKYWIEEYPHLQEILIKR
jgi:vacuolar-type H+-ATPase subunit I/STV1